MPFKKGQSGNPGGRKKEDNEVRELARKHTKAAVARLVYWMESEHPKASPAAAATLLDRGWGKPAQSLEHTGKDGGPLEAVIIIGQPPTE